MLRALFRPAQRLTGTGVYNLLSIAASAFVILGWLLPWFVGGFSGGIGFSAQDAVSSTPTGIGTFLLYITGICMLIVLLSPIVEWVQRARDRELGRRADAVRGIAGLVGLVLTLVVWILVRWLNEEPLFGTLPSNPITDSAVWLEMYGFGIAVVAYGMKPRVLERPNVMFTAAFLPVGVLLPLMFHQAPDFVLWATQALMVYMLLGLGLNVVVGFAGLLDLGYAAFFAIGGYTAASLASPIHSVHLPIWGLIFICAAVAATFGAILGAPTLRLRGDYLAIVTLGFGEIVPDLATNNVFGVTGGANGLSGIDAVKVGAIDFSINPQWFYWSLLAVSVLIIILLRNLYRARIGRAWVALREDEVAAAATGINTTSTKLLAFAIGASVSGFAGCFYGFIVSIVSPDDFQFPVSVAVLSIVVLGGIGNIAGVILGGFVLTFVIFWALPNLQSWANTFSHNFSVSGISGIDFTRYTYIIYGVALIAMMLFRPAGLLPSRARKIELEAGVESESLAAVQGRA